MTLKREIIVQTLHEVTLFLYALNVSSTRAAFWYSTKMSELAELLLWLVSLSMDALLRLNDNEP